MGHYRAEMVCNTCGDSICSCPVVDKPDLRWLVGYDYKPIKVVDFDKTHDMPLLHRYRREHFNTKQEAAAHAIELKKKLVKDLEASLVETKKQITKLKKELDEQ